MTYDDEQAVRDRLEAVARTTPPVGFGPAELIQRGRRQRRRHRGLAIGASAAALALVVAVPAVALQGRSTGGTGTPAANVPTHAPTGSSSASPAPPGGTFRVPGPVPGLTATEQQTLARKCGQGFGGDIGHVNATPGPGETQGPLVRDAARVFNAVRDAAGLHVLLYAPGTQISCDVAGETYSAGGSSGHVGDFPDWLPGPVSVDNTSGTGSDVVVEGRVSGAVSSVVVTFHEHTLRLTPVNGTYIARFLDSVPPTDGVPVAAYDRNGKLLGRARTETGCYTDPSGTVVIHGRADSGDCKPATPWR